MSPGERTISEWKRLTRCLVTWCLSTVSWLDRLLLTASCVSLHSRQTPTSHPRHEVREKGHMEMISTGFKRSRPWDSWRTESVSLSESHQHWQRRDPKIKQHPGRHLSGCFGLTADHAPRLTMPTEPRFSQTNTNHSYVIFPHTHKTWNIPAHQAVLERINTLDDFATHFPPLYGCFAYFTRQAFNVWYGQGFYTGTYI